MPYLVVEANSYIHLIHISINQYQFNLNQFLKLITKNQHDSSESTEL